MYVSKYRRKNDEYLLMSKHFSLMMNGITDVYLEELIYE